MQSTNKKFGVTLISTISLPLSVIDAHAQDEENIKITQAAKATIQASRFSEILVP